MSTYAQLLGVLDFVLIAIAVAAAFVARTDVESFAGFGSVAFYGPLLVLPLLWVLLLWVRGVYETRVLSLGTEEFRRIVSATVWLLAGVAFVSYLFKAEFSRFIVFVAIPLGVVLILLNHRFARSWLHSRRRHGAYSQRLLIVAPQSAALAITQTLKGVYQVGLTPVGVMAPPTTAADARGDAYLNSIRKMMESKDASALLLAPSAHVDADFVKRLSWDPKLGSADLYLAPQLTDVTGPRTLLQGVPDLPFIHLESPELSTWARLIKRTFDLAFSISLLILLSPLLVIITLAITVTSRGAPIFRQKRVGENGQLFTMLKFRTMYLGSDKKRTSMRQRAGQIVGTFKLRQDPRVTPLGRFLRRWSLDELPQLLNVFWGSMSTVGPRPHTLDDYQSYRDGDEFRLKIKPGLTGLQQVSGRSDLSWEDAVRADLRYLENWTFTGDLLLILRTIRAVASGRGAY